MKNILTVLLFLFITTHVYSQSELDNTKEINLLKIDLKQLNDKIENEKRLNYEISQEIQKLKANLDENKDKIDSLNKVIIEQAKETNNLISKVDSKIDNSINKTSSEITHISDNINQKTIYWIIIIVVFVIILLVIFLVLRKRITKNKSDIYDNIKLTTDKLQQDQLKLDGSLVKLLDTQMILMQEERRKEKGDSKEIDHSLALKVADEIVRIQKNLNNMDSETKGLKQLSASVNRIQDNFRANGYEMIDMLNKPFDQGMKVSPSFRTDTNLKKGEQLITRIIKPQVNFKGVMIQTAQIEVSVGE